MKRIVFTIIMIVFCFQLQAQKIIALTEATTIDNNSLFMVRAGSTGDLLKRITLANIMKDLTLTGTITLPATTSIGTVSGTEIGYVNNVTSAIQTQINAKETRIDSLVAVLADSVVLSDVVPLLVDTIPLVTFGAGAGLAADTALFNNNILIGSFFNDGSDTLVITQMTSVMSSGTGTETISVQISWDVNFKDGTPTNLGGSAFVIAGAEALEGGAGEIDTSFANNKIPPKAHVIGILSGASTNNKPTFLSVTLSGYKIPKY